MKHYIIKTPKKWSNIDTDEYSSNRPITTRKQAEFILSRWGENPFYWREPANEPHWVAKRKQCKIVVISNNPFDLLRNLFR